MPTHNRYPLNLLTLYSLEAQTCDLSKVEVILVDDASSDGTASLAGVSFPFHFRYLRLKANIGRPRARNMGIEAAQGELILFLDAEIIVPPGFLQSHIQLHRQRSRLIAGGLYSIRKTYTRMDPLFSPEQVQEAAGLLQHESDLIAKWHNTRHLPVPPALLGRQDIHSGRYARLSLESPHGRYFVDHVLSVYGDDLTGFRLPWIMAGTGTLSVGREAFERHGKFEEYEGWGADDIEMGYRLFMHGYQFHHLSSQAVYHQEHPLHVSIGQEGKHNFYLFQQKYRSIGILALLLAHVPVNLSYPDVSRTLDDVSAIGQHEPPLRYLHLLSTFASMLETLGRLNRNDLPLDALFSKCGILPGSAEDKLFHVQKRELAATGRYPHLDQALGRLLAL